MAEAGEIVSDSGAADNVMPLHMLQGVEMSEKQTGVTFTRANGREMDYHGRKEVFFVPLQFWENEFGFPFPRQAP